LTFLPDLLGEGLVSTVGDIRPGFFDPDSPVAETFDAARYLYAGLLTVGMAGQYVGGKLTDRMENARGIAIAFGVLAALALVFVPASAAGLGPLLAVSFVLGFFLFVVQPLYQATVAAYTPPGARGLSYGYTYLGVFGIGALGAAIAGVVLQYASPAALFAVLAVFASLASALGIVLSVRAPTTD
jgi:predicted MFS family arabinose efflux permease